jgi:hypothetical protein
MPEKLIVLDPTLEVQAPRIAAVARSGKISRLGLLDNGKPNSDRLLHRVAALLQERHPDIQIKYYRKPGAYRPAPPALLDQLVAECDTALVGIGD